MQIEHMGGAGPSRNHILLHLFDQDTREGPIEPFDVRISLGVIRSSVNLLHP